jgi:5-methyltetrahydropteroyltriglutamate--homocysteine methyltransferase
MCLAKLHSWQKLFPKHFWIDWSQYIRERLCAKADSRGHLHRAVECLRIASSVASDTTQIHTHMCYSEFNDIIDSIGAMDADIISIETARSRMDLLEAFVARYPNEIGPGIYERHGPAVQALRKSQRCETSDGTHLARSNLGHPDCGLKTRQWDEVGLALINMVQAARMARISLHSPESLA